MPLDSFGVLVGTLHRSFRDRPDDQGRWFHVNLEVDAPAGPHRCAVDVDSKMSTVGVQWKVLTLAGPQLAPVTGLAPGVHGLADIHQNQGDPAGSQWWTRTGSGRTAPRRPPGPVTPSPPSPGR